MCSGVEMLQKEVVIVGGGIAGLSAAVHLSQGGITDILILEASDRVGGRVKTEKFGKDPESTVELGAQYIGGRALTSSVITLANQFSLFDFNHEWRPATSRGFLYRSDGKAIDPELSSQAVALFEEWLDGAAEKDANVDAYIRQHLHRYLKKGKKFDKEDEEHLKACFNFSLNYLEFCLGGVLSEMPVKGAADCHDDIPGGATAFPNLGKVIHCLRDKLADAQILLNHEVKEMFYRRRLGKPVRVTCANGQVVDCNHIIVTCSLGYLKEHHLTLFNPPLSDEKQGAINNIGYGKVGKIFLHFDAPFWQKGNGRMGLAWKEAEREMADDTQWYKCIAAFDEVVDNSNVLVAFVTHKGVEMMETLPEENVKNTCVAVMRRFFNNPAIPEPTKILRSKWATDRFYKGTYCYLNSRTRAHDWANLEAPVIDENKPVIMFAGEAIRGNGCMHGARDSGLREAQRILDQYGLRKIPEL